MNKSIFLVIFVVFTGSFMHSNIYLWEQMTDSGPSCCLRFGGADICNPDTPCQHYMEADLAGIWQYASRLLSTERGAVEPYHTDLVQVTRYIRRSLNSPYVVVPYRLDQHRSVRFYHELIDAAVKSKDKGSPRGQTQKKQSQKYDYVTEYLIKLGLFIPHKKNNRL